MKRTRAQNPKLQDPQDPATAAANPNPKPQRKAKQPRQPKAGGKKASAAAAAREAASAASAVASAAAPVSEMAPVVPDVCVGGAGGAEVAGGLPADWDEMDGGGHGSPWWTFGVEEEKLLGWFPFVEEDFSGCHGHGIAGAGREPEPAGFDDDIWRIHQIYEIPSYAAK